MITSTERRMLLDFLSKHADGDVLIQAANRVANNLNDIETLRQYIEAYKPKVHPEDYLSEKGKELPPDVEEPKQTNPRQFVDAKTGHLAEMEDLGPVPKKLGRNGQDILNLLTKERVPWDVNGIAKKLKIPASKVKPMLALLLQRKLVTGQPPNLYVATP